MSEITNYPLCWPVGIPRTQNRKYASFGKVTGEGWSKSRKSLTVADALKRIQAEIEPFRHRISGTVLSTNVELRLDGLPRSDKRDPEDPGVCLYFKLDGKPHAMPCDKWTTVADNIAAIAAHLGAIRGMERWGVADISQMFTGFAQLPAPTPVRPWYDVLGVSKDAPDEVVQSTYRTLAKKHHPDTGGDPNKMAEINAAMDSYRASREAR